MGARSLLETCAGAGCRLCAAVLTIPPHQTFTISDVPDDCRLFSMEQETRGPVMARGEDNVVRIADRPPNPLWTAANAALLAADGPADPGALAEVARGDAVHGTAEDIAPMIAAALAKETVLEEAQRLVYGDRQAAYGHPYDDYSRTARMWEACLGLPAYRITPRLACLMMACVKISREVNAPKRDNMTDLAGYAACAQRCAEREDELNPLGAPR